MTPANRDKSMPSGMPNQAARDGNPSRHEGTGLKPRMVLTALRRRWFPCLFLGAIAAAAVAIPAWIFAPAPYTAHSEVHVESQLEFVLPGSRDPREAFEVFKQNQIKYLRSDFVLNAALREIGDLETIRERPYPREWLEGGLEVASIGTEFVSIKLSGERPEELAKIVNAVTAAYLNDTENREGGRRRRRIERLETVRAGLQRDKRAASDALRELSEQAGATTVKESENKQEALLSAASAVRQQYTTLYVDWLRKKFELDARNAALNDETPKAAVELPAGLVDAYLTQVPQYADAIGDLQEAESYVSALAKALSENSPRVAEARERVTSLTADRERLRTELLPQIEDELKQRLEEKVTGSTVQLEREIALLEAQVKGFEAQLGQFDIDVKMSQSFTFEIRERTKKLEEVEAFYAQVDTELQRLEIERETTAGVALFTSAVPPRERDQSKKFKLAGMGGAAGFGIVVVALLFFEIRKSRVDNVQDLVAALGIPILGSLPIVPRSASRSSRRSKHAKYWFDILTESVDSTRAVLVQQSRGRNVKTVLVGSATSGEGKTTVACHISASLARTGRNVLLVDCDVRKPSVGEVFDVDPSRGLSELLLGRCELEDVIRPSGQVNLTILPAGISNREVIDVLSTEDRVVPLIERLRAAYDVVVFDSPPLLAITDGLVLAHQVDGVLLAVRRDVSQLSKVNAAYKRLMMVGANVLGAVVIGLENSKDTSYYGYGYGYITPPAPRSAPMSDVTA